MVKYAQLAVLLLVMAAGLYSLDYAFNYSANAVFGSATGMAVEGPNELQTTDVCIIEQDRVTCITGNPRSDFGTNLNECKGSCRRELKQEAKQEEKASAASTAECGNSITEGDEKCDDGTSTASGSIYCPTGVVKYDACINCKQQPAPDCTAQTTPSPSQTTEQKPGEGTPKKEDLCKIENNRVICTTDNRDFGTNLNECKGSCRRGADGEKGTDGKGTDDKGADSEKAKEEQQVEGVDLVVKITDAPSEAVAGGGYQVKIKVTNRGREKSGFGSFYTVLHLAKSGSVVESISSKSLSFFDLKEGEDTIAINWKVPESIKEGAYELLAITDTANAVDEGANENNNRDSKAVKVVSRKTGGGNLVISSIQRVEASGDVLVLKLSIQNKGGVNVQRQPYVYGEVYLPVSVSVRGPVSCNAKTNLYSPEEIVPYGTKELLVDLRKEGGEPCILKMGNYIIEAAIGENKDWLIEDISDNTKRESLDFKTQAEVQCSGRNAGFRPHGIGKYCNDKGELKVQLPKNSACSNSYECESNLCLEGKCVASCVSGTGEVLPAGLASGAIYCSTEGKLITRKDTGECSKAEECISGLCVKGQCASAQRLSEVGENELKKALCSLRVFAEGVCT